MSAAEWRDLLAGLKLLSRGGYDDVSPLHCEHDELNVFSNPALYSAEELERLEELGFFPSEDGDAFMSFRFGSA